MHSSLARQGGRRYGQFGTAGPLSPVVALRGTGSGGAAPAPEAVQQGAGNCNLNRLNAPKKPKRIRFSDFESREAFEAAFRTEITVIPMADVPDKNIVDADDDDDAILLMALTRIFH